MNLIVQSRLQKRIYHLSRDPWQQLILNRVPLSQKYLSKSPQTIRKDLLSSITPKPGSTITSWSPVGIRCLQCCHSSCYKLGLTTELPQTVNHCYKWPQNLSAATGKHLRMAAGLDDNFLPKQCQSPLLPQELTLQKPYTTSGTLFAAQYSLRSMRCHRAAVSDQDLGGFCCQNLSSNNLIAAGDLP